MIIRVVLSLLISFLMLLVSISSAFSLNEDAMDGDFQAVGGWLLNQNEMISSYKNSEKYRLTLELITSWDDAGMPNIKLLDQMDFSLEGTDYISRGANYCLQKKKDPNLVVLLNPQGIYKAWTIDDSKFKEISIKGIRCILDDE